MSPLVAVQEPSCEPNMSEVKLTKTRIRAGVWEGVLSGMTAPPAIDVFLLETAIKDVTVSAIAQRPTEWLVRVKIPAEVLNDGVQTFLIHDRETSERLSQFTVITGVALEDDLRAEVDLLRAELDLLKRAFRRHCLETLK
jgi:hypothetical protein